MLALINLIIRRTRLAFRTPARLALFPLLSQSGCFILQLPTGFYSHCCGSGSEPSRREQRERGWIRPRPPDGRAVLCRPGGKQRAGRGGTSRPRSGGGMGPGVRAGGAGVGGQLSYRGVPKGAGPGRERTSQLNLTGAPRGGLGGFSHPKKLAGSPQPLQGLKRVPAARTSSLRCANRPPGRPRRRTSQGPAGAQRGGEELRRDPRERAIRAAPRPSRGGEERAARCSARCGAGVCRAPRPDKTNKTAHPTLMSILL